jgi:hypothetical protein
MGVDDGKTVTVLTGVVVNPSVAGTLAGTKGDVSPGVDRVAERADPAQPLASSAISSQPATIRAPINPGASRVAISVTSFLINVQPSLKEDSSELPFCQKFVDSACRDKWSSNRKSPTKPSAAYLYARSFIYALSP